MIKRLSNDIYKQASELSKKGMTHAQIAKVLGCSKSAIGERLRVRKKPADGGKIRALRLANWTFKDIAEEIRLDTGNYEIDENFIADCCRRMGI